MMTFNLALLSVIAALPGRRHPAVILFLLLMNFGFVYIVFLEK